MLHQPCSSKAAEIMVRLGIMNEFVYKILAFWTDKEE